MQKDNFNCTIFGILIKTNFNYVNKFLYRCHPFSAGGSVTIIQITRQNYTKLHFKLQRPQRL